MERSVPEHTAKKIKLSADEDEIRVTLEENANNGNTNLDIPSEPKADEFVNFSSENSEELDGSYKKHGSRVDEQRKTTDGSLEASIEQKIEELPNRRIQVAHNLEAEDEDNAMSYADSSFEASQDTNALSSTLSYCSVSPSYSPTSPSSVPTSSPHCSVSHPYSPSSPTCSITSSPRCSVSHPYSPSSPTCSMTSSHSPSSSCCAPTEPSSKLNESRDGD